MRGCKRSESFRGISLRIHRNAEKYNRFIIVVTQFLRQLVHLIRDGGTYVRTMSIDKCDNYDLALELRHINWIVKLIDQLEIGCWACNTNRIRGLFTVLSPEIVIILLIQTIKAA